MANVPSLESSKLLLGELDISVLSAAANFGLSSGVLANAGLSYFGATIPTGIDLAGVNIGPPLAATGAAFSLNVEGGTNIAGILNVSGIKNVFAVSNIFGSTSRVGTKVALAFNSDLGFKYQAAINKTDGPDLAQAFTKVPVVQADVLFGDISTTNGINGTIISAIAGAKGFDIPHPSKPNHRLRYICLEGPEVGAYVRGTLDENDTIELPDYWRDLVYTESITVNLTPIGSYQELFVDKIEWGTRIKIKNNSGNSIRCYYTVFGERKTKDKLQVEYEGLSPADYPGDNTEYSIAGYNYDKR